MNRSASVLLALVTAAALASCGDDGDKQLVADASELAFAFHNAMRAGDIKKVVTLVDYPFNFDRQRIAESEDELLKILSDKETKRRARRAVIPARKLEFATYEEFIDGTPVAGKSLEKEDAVREAGKIGLREGGILVRCYGVDEHGAENGRYYILVMHENALGDLKITTYYD